MPLKPAKASVSALMQGALRYLSYRSRSVKEVETYLWRKSGHNRQLTDEVMSKISQFNLLNDVEFTKTFVDYRLHSSKGPLLIKAELTQKGIDPNLINQTIGQIDNEAWLDSALQLITKKYPKLSSPINHGEKAKIYRLLHSRGYTFSTIYAVIDEIRSG